jgi:hypothetical protein
MLSARHIAWSQMEADRAFGQAKRARRRASLTRTLLRRCADAARLKVHDQKAMLRRTPGRTAVREIPLASIVGTFDAGRAAEFDREFRPIERTRKRWTSVWVADATGSALPPISVVRVDDGFAVLDGHHRVSVAAARGETTIAAVLA